MNYELFIFLLIVAIIWSLIWKGIALWKSARNNDKTWYVVMLIVNTLGILEILYIYAFRKKKKR
jgi:divalent metal cation (Fe/Co/Zn/Cd) transporter